METFPQHMFNSENTISTPIEELLSAEIPANRERDPAAPCCSLKETYPPETLAQNPARISLKKRNMGGKKSPLRSRKENKRTPLKKRPPTKKISQKPKRPLPKEIYYSGS